MPIDHAKRPAGYEEVVDSNVRRRCIDLLHEAQACRRSGYEQMTRESRSRRDWPDRGFEIGQLEQMFAPYDAFFLRDLAAVISMSASAGEFEALDLKKFQEFRIRLRAGESGYTTGRIAGFRRDNDLMDRLDWLCDAGHGRRDFPDVALPARVCELLSITEDIWLARYRLGKTDRHEHVYIVREDAEFKLFEIEAHYFPQSMFNLECRDDVGNFIFIQ